MQVDHGVDAVLGAEVDDAVEMLESRGLEDSRVRVVLKVAIVDLDCQATVPPTDTYRETKAVETQGRVELCVVLVEEILEELGVSGALQLFDPTLSKKNSYFSSPSTLLSAARTSCSCPGYPVMKFSMFTTVVRSVSPLGRSFYPM
jgi:hypothetical protein